MEIGEGGEGGFEGEVEIAGDENVRIRIGFVFERWGGVAYRLYWVGEASFRMSACVRRVGHSIH